MTVATIRYAHCPQQHTDTKAQRVAAIDASFGLGASVIGWTELETLDQITAVDTRDGWGTYWPKGAPVVAASNACTVSWRTDEWELVRGSSRFIHGGKLHESPARYVTIVRLRNIATGVVVRFVVTHWVRGIDPLRAPNLDYRRESLAQSVEVLTDVLEGSVPTIVSLDANTRNLPALVKVPGLTWHKTGPTHDSRQIDWVGSSGHELTPTQIATRAVTFLDHKATVADFSLVSADDHTDPEVPVSQRRLTTLADDFRKAGLKVVELDGWKTRSRPPSAGGFNPVGVLWHHTGAKGDGRTFAQWMATTGRPDLPAPLCQVSIDRAGVVYVLAAGRANHAGKAKASGSVAAGDGNSLYVGVECMNTGSEGWGKPQYDAMVKVGVALGHRLDCSVKAQRAHKETSVTGKWDPGLLDMDKFRADIAEAAAPPRPAAKTPNITAAIRAKTQAERVKALEAIVARSANPIARAAAKRWLASIKAANQAKADLKKNERN